MFYQRNSPVLSISRDEGRGVCLRLYLYLCLPLPLLYNIPICKLTFQLCVDAVLSMAASVPISVSVSLLSLSLYNKLVFRLFVDAVYVQVGFVCVPLPIRVRADKLISSTACRRSQALTHPHPRPN